MRHWQSSVLFTLGASWRNPTLSANPHNPARLSNRLRASTHKNGCGLDPRLCAAISEHVADSRVWDAFICSPPTQGASKPRCSLRAQDPQFVFSLNDGRLLSLAVAGWVLARCEMTCTASFEMSGRALIIWVFCLFITFLLTNTAASSPFASRLPLTRCVEEPVDGCKFSHFL